MDQEKATYQFLTAYITTHGYAPAYREIAKETGLPLASIRPVLASLSRAGRITWFPGIARGITLANGNGKEKSQEAH